jgi:hypothetical protein
MKHEFIILRDGKLESYENFDDIPLSFDNLIKFAPIIPPGPHTHDEHDEIGVWNEKMKILMHRETNGSNINRQS